MATAHDDNQGNRMQAPPDQHLASSLRSAYTVQGLFERSSPSLRESVWLVTAGLAAAALIAFVFCPRFVFWWALDLPLGWQAPEVNRAVDTWRLVLDPRAQIANPLNQVVRWRMLFPLFGHYLGLPRPVYMSLGPIGCVTAMICTLMVLRQAVTSRLHAFMMAVTLGASGWFFTSIGWLSYMDSWMMVGQLVTAFCSSRWGVVAACALTPWVDERFVLALPLCVLARTVFFQSEPAGHSPALRSTILIITAITAPYVLLRVGWLVSGQDERASSYLATHLAGEFPITRYLYGTWHGMRFAWMYVAALMMLLPWKRSPLIATLAVTIFVGNLIMLHAVVVGDISRTAATVSPVAIAGAIALHRKFLLVSRTTAPWLMALNLLAPAEHTITTFSIPIRYFYTELDKCLTPPPFMKPEFYTSRGVAILAGPRERNLTDQISSDALAAATIEFETAVAIDPEFLPALMHLGKCRLEQGRFAPAVELARRALEVDTDLPEAYHLLGCGLQALGHSRAARQTFQRALASAPDDWALRSDTQIRLERLRP